jgi:large subunit ribosomal protein L10
MISGLAREVADVDSCVVIGPRGLTVEEVSGLRNRLREKNIKMRVVKNSLAALALRETPMKGLSEILDGPSAILYGGEGAIAISKIIVEEVKKAKDKILIHGGFSEGEILDGDGIDSLSKAPTREEALSMLMGDFFAPVTELARGMDGLLTEVQGLIEALSKKQEGGGE